MTVCLACRKPWSGHGLQCPTCRTGETELDKSESVRKATEPEPDLFAEWCEQRGFPRPVAEYRFAPPRRWRFDWAWPDLRIAVEQEGGVWTGGRHVRGKGYIGDMEKYSEASVRGWTLIRRTPQDLCTADTLTMIRTAMERVA